VTPPPRRVRASTAAADAGGRSRRKCREHGGPHSASPRGVRIKGTSSVRHTPASMSADIAAIGPDTVDHAYCGLSRSSSEQGDSGGEEIAPVVPAPHFALDPAEER
jgi:hypothetical protein